MSKIAAYKYFTYELQNGRMGNTKVVITANKENVPCIADVEQDGRLWLWHEYDGKYRAVFEHVPPKDWIIKTTNAVYAQYEGVKDESLLEEWKECVIEGVGRLPRIILAMEDEEGISARRRKRFVFALPAYEDIRSKEIIVGLGFRWNTQKRMFEFYGEPYECSMMLKILSAKNLSSKLPVVNENNMFKYFPMLKTAQQESIRFIFKQWKSGWHGTLVADDMGIGKTLTALVAGKVAIDAGAASKIVVFANTSNIENWIKEWGKLNNTATGPVFAVTTNTMSKARYKKPELLQYDLASSELIIVNYEYAARNTEVMQSVVSMCDGAVTVFDEVTKCSNPDTANFKAAFKASMMSNFAIGLTGTPISKEIYEGWSIFRLLDPAIFPRKEFIETHRVEKTMRIWNPRLKQSREIVTYEYRCPDQFKQRIASHFIRHEKTSENIDATKEEHCYFIDSEKKLPELKIADTIQAVTSKQMRQDIDWDTVGEDAGRLPRWQISVLGYIQSALDDPYIIYESELFSRIACKEEITDEQKIVYDIMQSKNKESLKNYVPAKLKFVEKKLIKEWKDKHIILFYSSSRACERAAERITTDFPNLKVQTIIGSINTKKREERIEEFKNSPAGVLCCTDALAFGCNLQFADILVHMNLPWSTAVLKQRSDRIFRTGAEGQKEIYYLMLEHPLERRKINVLNRNLETIRKSTNIEMSALPPEKHVKVPSVNDLKQKTSPHTVKKDSIKEIVNAVPVEIDSPSDFYVPVLEVI